MTTNSKHNIDPIDSTKELSEPSIAYKKKTYNSNKELDIAIEEGLESLKSEGGIPHNEVMNEMKKKFPHIIK